MLTLPDAIVALLVPFATLFTSPTWRKAQLLLIGAILTPGQRTVAAALRVMGRRDQRDYARYHEVLNRSHSVEPVERDASGGREITQLPYPPGARGRWTPAARTGPR